MASGGKVPISAKATTVPLSIGVLSLKGERLQGFSQWQETREAHPILHQRKARLREKIRPYIGGDGRVLEGEPWDPGLLSL